MGRPRTVKVGTVLILATLLCSLLLSFSVSQVKGAGAVVWTDKSDYSPEETVTVFGSGFNVSVDVTVTVERPDGVIDSGLVVTDDVGSFTCTYQLNGITGTYTVTATDGTNTAATTLGTGAVVWTDKSDYASEETVTVFGSGFNVLADVTVTVERPNGVIDSVHAVTDDVGSFTCTYQLDGIGGTYAVTATDGTNTATTTFTDSSWAYRKQITIDNTKVENENFTNFPVLISMTDPDLAAHVGKDNGDDILFTASDGVTKLSHEIENFDKTTGTLVAWVKVPILYDNANTIIYMYYGNPSATNQENRAGVWDDNFKMVQHMRDNSTSTILDSTSNANNGVKTAGNEPIENTGKIGRAQSFDGANDYVQVSDSSSLDITAAITVEGWIKLASFSQPSTVAGKWRDLSGVGLRGYLLAVGTDGKPRFYISTNGANYPAAIGSTALLLNTWYHLAGTYDGTNIKLYVNGVQVATTGQTVTISTNDENLLIGANDGFGGTTRKFTNGIIDEVRISNNVRSAGWIKTIYNNQNSPSTFYSVQNQYKLTMATNFGNTSPTAGDTWENAGTVLTISATAPSVVVGERYVWNGWTGTGTGAYTGTDNPATDEVTMSSAITETALWTHQYYLTVNDGGHGTAGGAGWYNASTNAQATIAPITVAGTTGTRYVFNGWTGDASGSGSPSNNILMSGPKTATATWKTQYYLTVTSPYGTTGGEDWYDLSWAYRKQITIDNTKVESENFTNFPVLISMTDSHLAAHVGKDNGDDILFTASDGVTKLSHEIENFDNTTGTLMAWVKVPILYDNANTILYMYYGNPSAANQGNRAGVWDDNFKMVQHMKDNSTSTILDSTSNANNGVKKAANEPIENTGKIGKAQSFDGANDYVTVADSSSLEPNTITVEAWVKRLGSPGTYRYIVSKYLPDKVGNYTSYALYTGSSGGLRFYIGYSTNWVASPDAGTSVWDGNWHHVAGTFDGSAVKLYVDGVQVDGSTSTVQSIYYYGTGNLFIGAYTSTGYFFSGTIDEVRISNKARSAGWIKTIYNNQNSPSTFYSVRSSSGEGWYDDGTTAYATLATGTVSGGAGIQYVFTSWSENASGTGLTSDPITMNDNKTAIANWKTQYKLTMATNFGTTSASPSASDNWYDAGTVLTISATAPSVVAGERYVWNGWTGTGTTSYTGTDNPAVSKVTMSSAITETASWTHQYYLTVDNGGHGTASGSAWYNAGFSADFSISPTTVTEGTTRYVFIAWSGDSTSSSASASITMGSAKTVTANWKTQYYLTVRTDPAGVKTISGEGWYNPGTDVTLTAPLEPKIPYLFAYWDVDGVSRDNWANSITVLMNAPHTATAVYKDYLVDAIGEINSLRTYVTGLYNNIPKLIGKDQCSNFMSDSSKIVKDNIMKAMANLDSQRAGYDDKMKGFEGLRHATMKLNHMIKDENNWRRENKIRADNAAYIIGELEAIRMKLVNKAKGEALAEKALALKAIENANAQGKDMTKAWEEIVKVDNELNKAEQSILGGKLAQAIQHFKHAFAHSHHAIKKAYDKTWTINYKDWIDDLEVEDP